MKHSMPIMQKQKAGSFIAVASTAGLVGFNGLCPYIASKHAVCGMVKTACLENGPMNIRVNALAPGPVDNRMMASLGEQLNPDDPASVVDMVNGMVATNRYSTNEEKIYAAARKLGYPFIGESDSSDKTTIALVTEIRQGEFYSSLFHGLHIATRDSKSDIVFINVDGSSDANYNWHEDPVDYIINLSNIINN